MGLLEEWNKAVAELKQGDYSAVSKALASHAENKAKLFREDDHNIVYQMLLLQHLGHRSDIPAMCQEEIQSLYDVAVDALKGIDRIRETYFSRYGKHIGGSYYQAKSLKALDQAVQHLKEGKFGDPKLDAARPNMMRVVESKKEEPAAKRRKVEMTHCDPVSKFPNEILTEIFRYLSSADLQRAALVSSKWNYAVMSLSRILASPRFGINTGAHEIDAFCAACRKWKVTRLENVVLRGIDAGQEACLIAMLDCSDLKGVHYMDISTHGDLSFDFSRYRIWDSSSPTIFQHLQGLVLEFHTKKCCNLDRLLRNLPELDELSFILNYEFPDSGIFSLEPFTIKPLKKFQFQLYGQNSRYDPNVDLGSVFLSKCTFQRVKSLKLEGYTLRPVVFDLKEDQFKRILRQARPDYIGLIDATLNSLDFKRILDGLRFSHTSVVDIQTVDELRGGDKDLDVNSYDLAFSGPRRMRVFNTVPWKIIRPVLEHCAPFLSSLGLEHYDGPVEPILKLCHNVRIWQHH